MTLTNLKDFFQERIDASALSNLLKKDIVPYKRGNLEKGRSMPIKLDADIELLVDERALKRLSLAYSNGLLSELEVNYIADILLLSEDVSFKTLQIRDFVELLTDPEVNGKLTSERISEILERLSDL